MSIKDIRFPSAMRTTPLPSEPKDAPTPILNEEYIETVVPATPIDLLDPTTGADIAAEFEAKRLTADEFLCQDALVFLKAGLSPTAVIEIVRLRRGADLGVTKEMIEQAVLMAVELEESTNL